MRVPDSFIQVLADSYHQAVMSNANMRIATEALETIRSSIEVGHDSFKTWDIIDEQIGKAETDFLQPVLIQLRKKFTHQFLKSEIARLHEVFREDPQEGWKKLLLTYAMALDNWRVQFCFELIKEPFPLKPANYEEAKTILRYTKLVLHERWSEVYDLFIGLTEKDFIPNNLQANFFVAAGEIQLYHLNPVNPNKAKTLFLKAENIAPQEPRIFKGWGEYWLQQSEWEKAKEKFQTAIKLKPQMARCYAGIGECFEKEGNLDAAEEWHYEGIRNASGDASAYLRLLCFYSRSKLLSSHKEMLMPFVERAIALDPDYRYSVYENLSYIYQLNNNYEEAHKWLDIAIELDKNRLSGYTNKGYVYIQEEKYAQACVAFKEAIKVAPESFDGYWGLSLAQQRQKQWTDALHSYKECLKRRPDWKETIQESIDTINWELGKHDDVTQRLIDELRLKPENQKLINRLLFFAGRLYKNLDNGDAALKIYSEMREIKGASFEAEYHNLVGNLKYYNGQYQEAKDSYIEAVQNDSETATYYENLADAWKRIEGQGRRTEAINQSIWALEQANKLAPENPLYREDLETLRKKKSLITYFGERVLEMPMPLVTPIVLEVAGDLIQYVEKKEENTLSPQLAELTMNLRDQIFREMGVKIPGIRFRGNEDLEDGTYIISLMESPIITGQIMQGKRLFSGSLSDIAQLDIVPDQKAENPLTGDEAFWIDEKYWKKIESAKLDLWNVIEYPLRHLEAVIRKNLAEFLGHQEVMNLLESSNSDVCMEIQNSNERLTALVYVFQILVTEGVPITAFETNCRNFNSLYDEGTDALTIAERLRSVNEVRKELPGNNSDFVFYQLGQRLEAKIFHSIQTEGYLSILNMKPEDCYDILGIVRENIGVRKNEALIVDKTELRRFVQELIKIEFPDIPVLSRQELTTGLEKNIKALEPTNTSINSHNPPEDFGGEY